MTQWRTFLGYWGEVAAGLYLRLKGYKLIDRRFKTKTGEIDIIAWDGSVLCFIEVKTRWSRTEDPLASVTKLKRTRIIKTAHQYLHRLDLPDAPCRYDIVEISRKGLLRLAFSLHRDAFQHDDRYYRV